MKYEIGSLIIGTSTDKRVSAIAVIVEVYPAEREYRMIIQRTTKGILTPDFDSGTWSEEQLDVWESEYGYTFVK
jgi:hypothetical protein